MRVTLWVFWFGLWLAGCATPPALPPPAENPAEAWRAHRAELEPVRSWKIHGWLTLRAPEKSLQASFNWVRVDERHSIDLFGPLGRGHLRLTQDPLSAQLRDSNKNTYSARNAQQLLQQVTGWLLPLEGLNYWIIGLPAPNVAAQQELDAWGRLKTLHQLGWDIDFSEYTRHGSVSLPSKLYIKQVSAASASTPDVILSERTPLGSAFEVRLAIDRWQLDESREAE